MSKFKELCHFYSVSRKNYFDYWRECADFATDLIERMKKYFDMPDSNLSFVPLRDKPEYGKTYSAKESMHLEQDTFWYMGLVLTLCGEIEKQPEETLVLPLLIKRFEGNYTVKLGQEGEAFEMKKDDTENNHAFYDYVYDQIKNTYKDRLHKFLDGAQSERRIGFATAEQ
jgi:hypothetical protein